MPVLSPQWLGYYLHSSQVWFIMVLRLPFQCGNNPYESSWHASVISIVIRILSSQWLGYYPHSGQVRFIMVSLPPMPWGTNTYKDPGMPVACVRAQTHNPYPPSQLLGLLHSGKEYIRNSCSIQAGSCDKSSKSGEFLIAEQFKNCDHFSSILIQSFFTAKASQL